MIFQEEYLFYILLTDQTWLPLLLEISGNMCIVIVYFLVCDVIHVEIYLSFVVKQFSYMTKKSGQKFKYFKNEKWFHVEIKPFLISFLALSVVENCPRTESVPLLNKTTTTTVTKKGLSRFQRDHKFIITDIRLDHQNRKIRRFFSLLFTNTKVLWKGHREILVWNFRSICYYLPLVMCRFLVTLWSQQKIHFVLSQAIYTTVKHCTYCNKHAHGAPSSHARVTLCISCYSISI